MSNNNITFIDLFAGIGGIRLGFESIGAKCVYSSEWNKFSQKTYLANFNDDRPIVGDITKIDANDIPDHDVLLAGFPCQPFSLAGVSKKNSLGRATGFLDETQGTLFFDVARILEKKQPQCFLLENVKNLLSHDKGRTFKIIKKTLVEDLGYLTAIAGKPHLCSKGKNWVMKEYGAEIGEIYKKDKASFNEYYFKKCVCAAIIYLTVDNYLESNKKDPDFWYSAGGYKGNIVPYTISKIMASLPDGFTLNWKQIWDLQNVSSAFMHEIEKVTFLANTYFCSCGGVLVSEHCKKESTWTTFKEEYEYTPSSDFINELIPLSMDKEQRKSALHDQRETNDLKIVLDVIGKGEKYWTNILEKAVSGNILSSIEINHLKEVILFVRKGTIPCSSSGKVPSRTKLLINNALAAEAKLNEEGVVSYFDADDDIYELTLKDYKMH